VFREDQKLSQDSLMRVVEDFKSYRPKGVLMATAQGRVSEGLDFPDEELEMVLVVGIPYAPPSISHDALKSWCQSRFGEWKGIEYAVKVPAYRKMAQAIGRLIRTETDVGAAVILDRRAKQFSTYMSMEPSKDPAQDVVDFFSMKATNRR
jgi:DNA excision repair protein ERCC-2